MDRDEVVRRLREFSRWTGPMRLWEIEDVQRAADAAADVLEGGGEGTGRWGGLDYDELRMLRDALSYAATSDEFGDADPIHRALLEEIERELESRRDRVGYAGAGVYDDPLGGVERVVLGSVLVGECRTIVVQGYEEVFGASLERVAAWSYLRPLGER